MEIFHASNYYMCTYKKTTNSVCLVEFIFRIILYCLSSQDHRTSCFPELGFMLIWAGI